MNIQNSRILTKRSTTGGVVPTIPASDDHTDGSWLTTDIYKGELFINLVDNKTFTRTDSGIVQILMPTSGFQQGGNSFTAAATLGTNDLYDLLFETNNVSRQLIDSTGRFGFGTTSLSASTHKTNKSQGNTSAGWAEKWNDSDDALIASLDNNGLLSAYGGLSTDGTISATFDTVNNRYRVGDFAGAGASGSNIYSYGRYTNYNATGNDKVSLGNQAGYGSSGSNCLFSGYTAGYNSTSGSSVGIGYEALWGSSGDGLFGFGNYALKGNTGGENFAAGSNAGNGNIGGFNAFFGTENGLGNVADHVKSLGYRGAYNNTRSNLFTVAFISDIFWNNIGDEGYTTLQAVTMQSAMSADGTDTSAAASIFKIAPARATGNALSGNIVWQFANIQASGTTRHTLSDGMVYSANTGYLTAATSTSENVLLVGTYQSKSANYTALPTDSTIECTANTFTVTLYTAAGYKGRDITINNQGAGVITVDANSTETINGSLTQSLNQYDSMILRSNGTNWIIIASF